MSKNDEDVREESGMRATASRRRRWGESVTGTEQRSGAANQGPHAGNWAW
jgi:hypothetical protein